MIRRTLAVGAGRVFKAAEKAPGRLLKAKDVPLWRKRLDDWPEGRPQSSGAWTADSPKPPSIGPQATEAASLRLLSFNIQLGIRTSRYRQYVTKGWKHLLPHSRQAGNLERIAKVVAGYDLVALQEVDGGSLRSGFVNQVEYLASRAGFPYWYAQLNRDLGPLAQHGNGLLARVPPWGLEDHKLPGAIPGRGAIVVRVRCRGQEILVVVLHLSLGGRSRQLQLGYVRELIHDEAHAVVMGDMNSHLSRLLRRSPLAESPLRPAAPSQPTWPAWRPALALDHVLVTPGIRVDDYAVLDCRLSDHRPIAVTLSPH